MTLNMLHPNERQLQRFLNRACSELEFKRIQQHIHTCSDCRNRLHTYLNLEELLNKMDVLAPSSGFAERVMQGIRTESSGSLLQDKNMITFKPEGLKKTNSRSRIWHPELVNGMIATAATYLFISSGILSKIITINAGDWESGVQSRFEEIGLAVHKLSMYLIS